MTRELQLKSTIIQNFIPLDEAQKIHERAQWDADREDWVLGPLSSSET